MIENCLPRVRLDVGKRNFISLLKQHHDDTVAVRLLFQDSLLNHLGVMHEAKEFIIVKLYDLLRLLIISKIQEHDRAILGIE